MTCNEPCSSTTPNAIDKSGLLSSQVMSSQVNPTVIALCDFIAEYNHIFHHHDDLDTIPWNFIHPGGSSFSSFSYNIPTFTPHRRHQSLQSCLWSLLPPQPPQITVIPAPLPPELVELLVAASPGLIERFIILLRRHERSVSWRLLMNLHGQFFKQIFH